MYSDAHCLGNIFGQIIIIIIIIIIINIRKNGKDQNIKSGLIWV